MNNKARIEKILGIIELFHEDKEFMRKYIENEINLAIMDGRIEATIESIGKHLSTRKI